MLPVPVALSPLAPPVAVAVQVSEPRSGFEARRSPTCAPVAVEGPLGEASERQGGDLEIDDVHAGGVEPDHHRPLEDPTDPAGVA